MDIPLFIENKILINSPASKVWAVLVNPEQTKKYMFGCETISDWKQGSTLLWQGQADGKEIIYVSGIIVEIVPEKFLEYTAFDPNSTMDDIPENHLHVTYSLEEENGQTSLSVTQGDYSKVAEGERRYNESYNNGEGWNPILVEIKKIAEIED